MNDHLKQYCHVFMLNNPFLDCSNEMNKKNLKKFCQVFTLDASTLNYSNGTTKVSERRRQNKVPRPPNAFILYRKDKQFNVMNQYNLSNCQVSK
ncbi:13743_t:CDS:1, partial [Gigaspora margarita]